MHNLYMHKYCKKVRFSIHMNKISTFYGGFELFFTKKSIGRIKYTQNQLRQPIK